MRAPAPTVRFWWRRTIATAAILFALALALAELNNNASVRSPSRAEFVAILDLTLDRATNWTLHQYQEASAGKVTPEGRSLMSNSATAHMIVDCASISDDPRIKEIGSGFLQAWKLETNIFGKMVDPTSPINPPTELQLQSLEEYQRWTLHGAAPNDVSLSPPELEHMFSPDAYRTGKLTHQLLALYFYRKSKGSTPELERLMQHLEARIARESALDFRVTDLYLQRLAFLLAAGRPDLIRPRWVERAFAAQQFDGGWLQDWHGWSRTPYQFSLADNFPTPHATAQGLWIACMLKYRYPDWIKQNYK